MVGKGGLETGWSEGCLGVDVYGVFLKLISSKKFRWTKISLLILPLINEYRVGLCTLCWHKIEHNRLLKALGIIGSFR